MARRILEAVLRILWPAYFSGGNSHSLSLVMRYWVIQKVFRINAAVPWPVHPTSTVLSPDKIVRGSRTPGLSKGCHIDGRNGIEFGHNVWVGPGVSMVSMNHNIYNFTEYESSTPIKIGSNSWLATNCVVLAGVELGPHTIVAAGAVVTKSFTKGNQMLAGVPAKEVKQLDEYDSSI